MSYDKLPIQSESPLKLIHDRFMLAVEEYTINIKEKIHQYSFDNITSNRNINVEIQGKNIRCNDCVSSNCIHIGIVLMSPCIRKRLRKDGINVDDFNI